MYMVNHTLVRMWELEFTLCHDCSLGTEGWGVSGSMSSLWDLFTYVVAVVFL